MGIRPIRIVFLSLLLAILFAAGLPLLPGAHFRASITLTKGEILTRQHEDLDYFLYLPTSIEENQPVTVLVTFRGIGDKAEAFAKSLVPEVESRGWVLVVPRFAYNSDWRKIEVLRSDAEKLLPWLDSLLAVLATDTSIRIRDRVLLYGFSRGAQSAHRFALMFPGRVLAVAVMSAGSYTLPVECLPASGNQAPLEFPLGIGDIGRYCGEPFNLEEVRKVTFWVGVGERDNTVGEVPPTFDRYIGNNRVERAKSFAKAMADIGARVELAIFPNLGHRESSESRARALDFLKRVEGEAESASGGETIPTY